MPDNSLHFYKKGFKGNGTDPHSFSFPSSEASIDIELALELKMHQALLRFANKLFDQLDKERRDLIGIKINGITFQMMYAPQKGNSRR